MFHGQKYFKFKFGSVRQLENKNNSIQDTMVVAGLLVCEITFLDLINLQKSYPA